MIVRRSLAALLALPFAGSACAREREPVRDGRDGLLDQARIDAASPAMGAVLVNRDGVVWTGVSGVRRTGGSDPVVLDDRWHLGSNTKAMTALLYARLVEAGLAEWGATLADLFPQVTVDPALGSASVEAVLSHRAGLAEGAVMGRSWLMTARGDERPLPSQRADLARAALTAPPAGTPGQFAYSNLNYVVIGSAIERITGQPWEDAMRDRVFAPLTLTSGGFGAPPSPAPWGHRSLAGLLMAMDPADPGSDNPLALGPAGTAHMALADYAKWLQVFLGAAPDGFVSADSLRRLTTPAAEADYALGWGAYASRPWATGPVLAHEGSNTLWRVAALVAPEQGLACAVVANRDTDACARLGVQLMREAAGGT